MDVQRFRAAWILPVDGDPIPDGTIEIDASGRIAALHDKVDPRATDLGRVAILPGLVNAHTHLEFSDIESPLEPPEPFTDWIRSVVKNRRGRATNGDDAVRSGLAESIRAGTTLLGEIATNDNSAKLAQTPGPLVVAFFELIGLQSDQAERQMEIALRHLQQPTDSDSGGIIPAISPHAPYSVHPELFVRLVKLATQQRCPLAIHLAETQAELELLDRSTGPFVDLLTEFGVWHDGILPVGGRPLWYLQQMAELQRGLVIHGNYLSDEEVVFLAAHENLTVVYCPRTHAYFRHDSHPWLQLLDRGARVAVGTDSRASNPDLSVWRELCFLRNRHAKVDPRKLLELGTICGARAMGLQEQTGSLTVGKRADMTVVRLPAAGDSNPYSNLLRLENEIAGTLCGGQWAHRTI
ncbi:MAG: amidohydrolase family protein [Planctomycetaceae bacterium]|jgi:aminodeoxyfutalosine deaminase|nr:amidohydrolase family protein [Planctomycetaceae bacterium]MBT6153271.1 amidohydrolase family protein [Planctomycetaceae bacterium]MBT6486928.1 amidohydrolase family protein [Planctomycetaceae bacterium]MBT6493612.1 amidohydrolase family protein [Planctomycetaceae bacterium]